MKRKCDPAEVIHLRETNPCMKGVAIAHHVGISRQRVEQILKKHGLANAGIARRNYLCQRCGTIISCIPSKLRRFCATCRPTAFHVPFVCDECGKLVSVGQSQLLHRLEGKKIPELFCSKPCYYKWQKKHHYGRYGSVHQSPQTVTIRWYYRLGFTKKEICKYTGLPPITVYRVLRNYGYEPYEDSPKHRIYHRLTMQSPKLPKPPTLGHMPWKHIRVRWLCRLNFTEREIRNITGCGKATYYRAVYQRVGA